MLMQMLILRTRTLLLRQRDFRQRRLARCHKPASAATRRPGGSGAGAGAATTAPALSQPPPPPLPPPLLPPPPGEMQGCRPATRFRDCRAKTKIKKNLLSPSHVAARRSRRYKTRPNTEFVFGRLHEM